MGRHQLRLLKFAIKYQGWHTYGTDKPAVKAIKSLVRLELLVENEFRQFKLNTPQQEV